MSCPKNCQKKRQTNKIGVDFQQTANGRASLFVAKHKAWPMVHPSCMMKAAPTSGGGQTVPSFNDIINSKVTGGEGGQK